MEVNICLEAAGPCTLELPILKDLKVPKPVCSLEKSFSSFGTYIFVCLHYKFSIWFIKLILGNIFSFLCNIYFTDALCLC